MSACPQIDQIPQMLDGLPPSDPLSAQSDQSADSPCGGKLVIAAGAAARHDRDPAHQVVRGWFQFQEKIVAFLQGLPGFTPALAAEVHRAVRSHLIDRLEGRAD